MGIEEEGTVASEAEREAAKELLTPEELADLDADGGGEEMTDEQVAAAEAHAANTDPDTGNAAQPNDPNPQQPAPAADPAPAGEDEAAAAQAAAAAPAPAPEPEPAPAAKHETWQPPTGDVAAARQVVDGEKAARLELTEKYDDGDLSSEEFHSGLSELSQAVQEASQVIGKAQYYEQHEANQWTDAVRSHVAEYPELEDSKNVAAWDREVSVVSQLPQMANKSYADILKTAHARVAAFKTHHGVENFPDLRGDAAAPAPTPNPAPTPPASKVPPDAKSDPALSTVPQTVRQVPQSEAGAVAESKWAAVDAVMESNDVEAQERALAAMSDVERDEYLRS